MIKDGRLKKFRTTNNGGKQNAIAIKNKYMNKDICEICHEDINDRGGYCDIRCYSSREKEEGRFITGKRCTYMVMCCQTCFDQIEKDDIINIISNKFYRDENDGEIPINLSRSKTKKRKKE